MLVLCLVIDRAIKHSVARLIAERTTKRHLERIRASNTRYSSTPSAEERVAGDVPAPAMMISGPGRTRGVAQRTRDVDHHPSLRQDRVGCVRMMRSRNMAQRARQTPNAQTTVAPVGRSQT